MRGKNESTSNGLKMTLEPFIPSRRPSERRCPEGHRRKIKVAKINVKDFETARCLHRIASGKEIGKLVHPGWRRKRK